MQANTIIFACCGAVLAATALWPATVVAGEVYRWVDAQGRVHYSDRPARHAEKVDVRVPGAGSSAPAGPAAAATPSTPALAQGKPSGECAQKRQELERYQNASSIREVGPEGIEREYSADERQRFIARLQAEAQSACGGS